MEEVTKKLISLLITSYRYLTAEKKDFAVLELQRLIDIKKTNPEHFLLLNSDGLHPTSCLDEETGTIYI